MDRDLVALLGLAFAFDGSGDINLDLVGGEDRSGGGGQGDGEGDETHSGQLSLETKGG